LFEVDYLIVNRIGSESLRFMINNRSSFEHTWILNVLKPPPPLAPIDIPVIYFWDAGRERGSSMEGDCPCGECLCV